MKKHGRGISLIGHLAGTRFGCGDATEAFLKMKTDGSFELLLGTVDIGQGSTSVMRRLAAEALDVSLEQVGIVVSDTTAGAFCTGTAASRVTFSVGNGVLAAIRDFKERLCAEIAKSRDVPVEQVSVSNARVHICKDGTDELLSYEQAARELFGKTVIVIGHGLYMYQAGQRMDPEGKASFSGSGNIAYGACVVDVEVDTDTGEIEITDIQIAQDVGTALNPIACEGQVQGGMSMSLGESLMEQLFPSFPDNRLMANGFHNYIIPTAMDMPPLQVELVQIADPDGPYGAKGFSEGCCHFIPAALTSAVHDATGVWIHALPMTPEKVLMALEAERS